MNNQSYEHDYYKAGMEGMEEYRIPEVLGNAEAMDEWDNPLYADANYININAYRQFEDQDCVFLVGRIGSGKTEMLNKLKFYIEQEKCKKYASVAMIDTRDYIAQLGKALRLSDCAKLAYSEIEHTARVEWEKVLNTIAMKALLDKYGSAYPNEFRNITAYLSEQGEEPSKFTITELLKVISENLGKLNLIGSCKFKNEAIGTDELDLMQRYTALFTTAADECFYYIFSKSGFTSALLEKQRKGVVTLISIEEMYQVV